MVNQARILDVSEADRKVLQSRLQARTARVRDLERAWIVMLAAEGLPAVEIAARVGCSRPTVTLWRSRYATRGLDGLDDAPRSGAPPKLTQARTDEILAATLAPPPEALGVTHWSSRLLARHVGHVSHVTITRLWKRWHLQPWGAQTFRFPTDPDLVAKVTDIAGVYLHPPDDAIVLCVDEKGPHDHRRHGTTTLLAALQVQTGEETDPCPPYHRGVDFPSFLERVAKTYPHQQLRIVADTDVADHHDDVDAWLAKNPRIQVHVTPNHASWLNLVETFLSIIAYQPSCDASFASVRQVTDAIRTLIDDGNDRCVPFSWTRTADGCPPSPTGEPLQNRTTRS